MRLQTKAFSLIEVILAVAIFAIIGGAMVTATLGFGFSAKNSNDRIVARYLTQEAEEALRSIRNYDWASLNAGTYGLISSNGYWELSGANDTYTANGKTYTRTVALTETTTDLRFEAVITISWTTIQGISQTMVSTMRLTNWESRSWLVDSYADFEEGYFNSSESLVGGSVQMQQLASFATPTYFTTDTDGDAKPNDFTIVDNYLYWLDGATSGDEFIIYDLKDVSSDVLTEVAAFDTGVSMNDIAIAGNYAYVATSDDNAEVKVYNIATYAFVQNVDLEGTADANGIDVSGTTLVVARSQHAQQEVQILDVSTPEGSITVSNEVESGATLYDVEINDGYAFFGTSNASFEFVGVDLSDLSTHALNLTGTCPVQSVFVDSTNDMAYVGCTTNATGPEFFEVNIATPSSPTAGDSIEIGGSIYDVFYSGGYAYTAGTGASSELLILDTTANALDVSVNLSGSGTGYAVWFDGVQLYGASGVNTAELQVLTSTTSGWTEATHIGSGNPAGLADALDVAVSGNYAYLGITGTGTCVEATGANCEFAIYDISTPSAPSLVAAKEATGSVNEVVVSGNYAYLGNNNNSEEFIIYDISTPASPTKVSGYDTVSSAGNGNAIVVSGSYAYLGTDANTGTCASTGQGCEFFVIDISNPAAPTLTGKLEIGFNVNSMVKVGNYVYLGTSDTAAEVKVIDVSTPSSPTANGAWIYNNAGTAVNRGLYYDSTYGYLHMAFAVNTGGEEYVVASVSGTTITYLGGFDIADSFTDVVAIPEDHLAFLTGALGNNEFRVIDYTNTSNPVGVYSLDMDANTNGIFYNNSHIFMASAGDTEELQVIQEGTVTSTRSKNAIYTSKAFDSGSASTTWGTLSWTASGTTVTGTLKFKIRTASSEAGLLTAMWVGSDGTSSSYYTTSGTTIDTYDSASGTRWIQIAAYYTGNGSTDNPQLEVLTTNY